MSKSQSLEESANAPLGARELLVDELRHRALVIGEVTLTSGATAQYYVDAKRAILTPRCFLALGTLISHHARRLRASAVGGVPISAIPVACAALAAAARERSEEPAPGPALEKAFIVRRERKEHGLGRLIEGPALDPGERCLIVEDVVTTGGSTVELIERLRDEDVTLAGVVSVLDRLAGGAAAIEAAAQAPYVALTTIDDIYPGRPDR